MSYIYKLFGFKRFFFIFVCIILIFSMCLSMASYAFLPALVEAPEIAGLLAKIIVTAGVTYVAADAIDYCVDAVYGNLSLEQQAALQDLAHSGRYVIDAATGAYKYVVDVTQDVWDAVHDVCSSLWDVGENTLTDGESGVLDVTVEPSISGFSSISFYTTQWHSYGNLISYTLSGDVLSYYFDGSLNETYHGVSSLSFSYSSVTSYVRADNIDGTHMSISWNDVLDSDIVYDASAQVGTIEGAEELLDNTDFNWGHNDDPNDKRVVFWPTIPEGSTLDTSDTSTTDVIDYDLTKDELVGATADDIAAEDVSGVPVPSTTTVINDGEVDTPTTPEAGSEENTSLKALFFSKFPFCIPWDIKNAFSLLAAEPETPHWKVDLIPQHIKNECGMTSDQTEINIDLSDYEIIGQVCRWTATIGFCIALAAATRKIIHS